jgi:hypothetical protein
MRTGLPVRWALAVLVPLAIAAFPAALAAFRRDAQRFREAGRGTHA